MQLLLAVFAAKTAPKHRPIPTLEAVPSSWLPHEQLSESERKSPLFRRTFIILRHTGACQC